ncbi:hypothetical protein VTN77DRAFT_8522 [Rasamsonia byssochlamydoides]|uniref:uncharacterized protein n=1 Tax=Rasamsonia byssochlamydoides TaxID=89139 RepID=UPI0037442E22
MLLNLPTELIQLILQYTTTPSYLHAALSCRTLFYIASTYRDLIIHHLKQTPGLKSGVELRETKDLFLLLRRRAAKQLYGANFYADRTLYDFSGRSIDVGASSIADNGCSPNVALVLRDDELVHLFHTGVDGSTSLKRSLKFPYEQPGTVKILKTAFTGDNGISVLVQFTPTIADEDADTSHPFVKHALESRLDGEIILVHYSLDDSDNSMAVCTFPDHNDYEPLALAVTNRSQFAISWQHVHDHHRYEVVLYDAVTDCHDSSTSLSYLNYRAATVADERGLWPKRVGHIQSRLTLGEPYSELGPVTRLVFNDRGSQLLYYYRGSTLYRCYQNIQTGNPLQLPGASASHLNYCWVQFSDSQTLPLSVAIPFFGTHNTYRTEHNHEMCRWRYLSFGTATHLEENWTVACLLKSEAHCQARNCGHVLNRERGRRLNAWTIVARLWGYQKPTNSLGCIIATTENGTRIAVANWNMIYVWALDPHELIDENTSDFYPETWRYGNSNVVELRPIVLRLEAVCFKLSFTEKENELVALTDRGLMVWNLSPRGTGARITRNLDVHDVHS